MLLAKSWEKERNNTSSEDSKKGKERILISHLQYVDGTLFSDGEKMTSQFNLNDLLPWVSVVHEDQLEEKLFFSI